MAPANHTEENLMPKTVGRFTWDPATSTVTGPAEYMASDQYKRLIEGIYAGTNAVFNFGAAGASPDVETALLVTIQTDFAGWHGAKTFCAAMGSR